jgi:hypothetical protein
MIPCAVNAVMTGMAAEIQLCVCCCIVSCLTFCCCSLVCSAAICTSKVFVLDHCRINRTWDHNAPTSLESITTTTATNHTPGQSGPVIQTPLMNTNNVYPPVTQQPIVANTSIYSQVPPASRGIMIPCAVNAVMTGMAAEIQLCICCCIVSCLTFCCCSQHLLASTT